MFVLATHPSGAAETVPNGPYVGNRDVLIEKAMGALRQAAPRAQASPQRPVYHLRPIANWMNDINGAYFQDGTYHIMYQHNPYGDTWGNMHWGHAVSRDLVHWKHLPIAIWPSGELGEEHCYSGGAMVRPDGKPMVFYTSIGHEHREEWAAISHDKGVTWEKYPRVVEHQLEDGARFSAQDPFMFRHDDKYYLLSTSFNGKNAVGGLHLYEAEDDRLLTWRYRGRFSDMQEPCPAIARLGDKWVLLFHGKTYHVGDIDWANYRFVVEESGTLAHSHMNFVGTNLIPQGGRTLLFAWVTRRTNYDEPGRGWAGCCSLPTEFSLGPDNKPRIRPAPELVTLRESDPIASQHSLKNRTEELDVRGDTLELHVELAPSTAKTCGIRIRHADDGRNGVDLTYADGKLSITGTGEKDITIPVEPTADGAISLRLYLDKAILEAFINDGRHCAVTYMHNDPADQNISVFSTGGAAAVSVKAWKMKTDVQGSSFESPMPVNEES
jgi:beta-fructofuranosidase